MKKIYTLAIGLLLTIGATAQTNLNFETWSGSPEAADGWTVTSAFDSISKVSGADALEGSFSMRVANNTMQDIALADSLGGSYVFQAIPGTYDSVKVVCESDVYGTDTAQVAVVLINGTTPVGQSTIELHANNTSPGDIFQLTFNLVGAPAHTGIALAFYSSKSPDNVGTSITVDDVELFAIPVSIDENDSEIAKISAYPNPATNMINFTLGNTQAESIRIMDATGRVIETISVNSSIETLELSNFNNGVYFYQVVKNNDVLKTSKFIVRK